METNTETANQNLKASLSLSSLQLACVGIHPARRGFELHAAAVMHHTLTTELLVAVYPLFSRFRCGGRPRRPAARPRDPPGPDATDPPGGSGPRPRAFKFLSPLWGPFCLPMARETHQMPPGPWPARPETSACRSSDRCWGALCLRPSHSCYRVEIRLLRSVLLYTTSSYCCP